MTTKKLTRDCPSCKLMHINDDNKFICMWGNHKKTKILVDSKVREKCTLKR